MPEHTEAERKRAELTEALGLLPRPVTPKTLPGIVARGIISSFEGATTPDLEAIGVSGGDPTTQKLRDINTERQANIDALQAQLTELDLTGTTEALTQPAPKVRPPGPSRAPLPPAPAPQPAVSDILGQQRQRILDRVTEIENRQVPLGPTSQEKLQAILGGGARGALAGLRGGEAGSVARVLAGAGAGIAQAGAALSASERQATRQRAALVDSAILRGLDLELEQIAVEERSRIQTQRVDLLNRTAIAQLETAELRKIRLVQQIEGGTFENALKKIQVRTALNPGGQASFKLEGMTVDLAEMGSNATAMQAGAMVGFFHSNDALREQVLAEMRSTDTDARGRPFEKTRKIAGIGEFGTESLDALTQYDNNQVTLFLTQKFTETEQGLARARAMIDAEMAQMMQDVGIGGRPTR